MDGLRSREVCETPVINQRHPSRREYLYWILLLYYGGHPRELWNTEPLACLDFVFYNTIFNHKIAKLEHAVLFNRGDYFVNREYLKNTLNRFQDVNKSLNTNELVYSQLIHNFFNNWYVNFDQLLFFDWYRRWAIISEDTYITEW